MVKPVQKREVVQHLISSYQISIRQACCLVRLHRSSFYYIDKPKDDHLVIAKLNELASNHPSYGFKKMFYLLRNQGYTWNHKKVYRIYKQLGMNLTRKRKRR